MTTHTGAPHRPQGGAPPPGNGRARPAASGPQSAANGASADPSTRGANSGRADRPGAPRPGAHVPGAHTAPARTLQALTGAALGIMPLRQMFIDSGWLVDAWVTMALVVGPAALLRLRREPDARQLLPGLLLAVGWITARFLPTHAIGGVLPGPGAWRDTEKMLTQLHEIIDSSVAPLHTTAPVQFIICVSVAILAACIDLIAVVARRAALTGIPLLIVFTVSGAVPRQPVNWLLFVLAASGFLVLLAVDASDDLHTWGRMMPRAGSSRPAASFGVSGQRIALIAILVAVLLPLAAPSSAGNVIANAFHHGPGSGNEGDFGADAIGLDPFAALRGTLVQSKPEELFTVTVDRALPQQPGYLRSNVLMTYTPKGWIATSHGPIAALDQGFDTDPPSTAGNADSIAYTALIQLSRLRSTPPVLAQPVGISALPDTVDWSTQDQILLGAQVGPGTSYTEQVVQPAPTPAQLESAPASYAAALAPWLQVPKSMPSQVRSLVSQLTGQATTPYDRAIALQDYFTDPANGFSYNLRTAGGDSGSDLVDFLTNKVGYCQQYAAAMGIMLRIAGVPARVVLGYTHPVPNAAGSFTVTTNDAHAWVEAYFNGIGWIPFDPTPLAGIAGGAANDLPWAPHPPVTIGSAGNTSQPVAHPGLPGSSSAAPSLAGANPAKPPTSPWPLVWISLGALVAALLTLLPGTVRWVGRRRRLHAGRLGHPDSLWAELSATAIDLGRRWSPARSPRQVVTWLGRGGGSTMPGDTSDHGDRASSALAWLASAVESARYSPQPQPVDGPGLVEALLEVERGLRSALGTGERLRARLFPASLGWRWLPRARGGSWRHRR